MIINTEIIRKLKPCQSRFNNYLTHYKDFEGSLEDFILLDNITYSDKVWVVTRLFTKKQNVKWSLLCASKVLSIFEEKYPEDKRPRKALETSEVWLNNPSEENRLAAYAAAADAARAANAARAAADAAYAAYASAWVAVDAAADAAGRIEEEVNLLFMLECI